MKKICLDIYTMPNGQKVYCILFEGHRSGHDYRSEKSRDYQRIVLEKRPQ